MSGLGYWIVACSTAEVNREDVNTAMKKLQQNKTLFECNIFDVPLNIKYRSFDDLMRLVDELSKCDAMAENAIRRVERQAIELDPSSEFNIIWQRNSVTIDQYIKRFSWDDAKYPRTRQMQATAEVISQTVSKLEEEVRIKAGLFNETKQSHTANSKQDMGSYNVKNLADVLTPDVVDAKDFIDSEHLVTVVAVVPRNEDENWLKSYESMGQKVVPRSAKKFKVSTDKDQNSLWRVVVFRKHLEELKNAARVKKVNIREFEFSSEKYQKRLEEKSRMEADRTKHENLLSRICAAAFSEIFIAWMHLKAMRTFVESVLRYGVPPRFAAFTIQFSPSKERKVTKELDAILGPKHRWGQNAQTPQEDDDEFLSFVQLSFVPRAAVGKS